METTDILKACIYDEFFDRVAPLIIFPNREYLPHYDLTAANRFRYILEPMEPIQQLSNRRNNKGNQS